MSHALIAKLRSLLGTFPLAPFALVFGAICVVDMLAIAIWGIDRPREFPTMPWFEGLYDWDSGWYYHIVAMGYYFRGSTEQSAVAFFPTYPILMKAVGLLIGNHKLAGVLVSLACGAGAVALFHRWVAARSEHARVATWVLMLSPFSFFLYGVVYSDSTFLFFVLASFYFLERKQFAWAALMAIAVTAGRPPGIMALGGMVAVALERRGALSAQFPWIHPRRIVWRDSILLFGALGLVLYCTFLYVRFGDPIAFVAAAGAPGWDNKDGPEVWLKFGLWRALFRTHWHFVQHVMAVHLVITVAAFALIPQVIKRYGIGYGLYCVAVLAMPAVASKDLFGMGRYTLAAFPCFAAAGELLAVRPRTQRALFALSGGGMLVFATLFARMYYVS